MTHERDAFDRDGFDRETEQLVQDTLRDFARSLDAEPLDSMPEHVWERVQTALSIEAGEREGAQVLDFNEHRQRRISGKWVGGLVAASVTLVAVGLGVNVLSPDNSPDTVVADSAVSVSESNRSLVGSSPQVIQAGFVPPAVQVMETGTNYSESDLSDRITSVLKNLGITKAMDMYTMPVKDMVSAAMTKKDGMTADYRQLRDCVTAITKSETSQAILVDRATFQGMDAGIVVIPMVMFTGMDQVSSPEERLSYVTDMYSAGNDLAELDIWVVGPECGTRPFDPFEAYSHITFSFN